MTELELKFWRVDSGNDRIYYRSNKGLVCFINNDGYYFCTNDGEPSHPVNLDQYFLIFEIYLAAYIGSDSLTYILTKIDKDLWGFTSKVKGIPYQFVSKTSNEAIFAANNEYDVEHINNIKFI
jgi:hypothetical protein